MNCSEAQELLSAYFDGELAADTETRVSEHLDGCSDCAARLARFDKLSVAASALGTPAPPEHMWGEIQQQLDEPRVASPAKADRRWVLPMPRLLAIAATLLVAVGIGWFTRHTWYPHEHDEFTAHFDQYLQEFGRDPDAAQQILLSKYEGQAVNADQAIDLVGYRPAVADGLPSGYTVASTHVMKMPCCTCVQTLCKREDGSTLAIFEHDDEETTDWFGDRPSTTCQCGGKHCCMVELDDQIAASWKRGKRHITLIGVRDTAEVEEMVAWLDEKKRPGSS